MKTKTLLIILFIFMLLATVGAGYSAWTDSNGKAAHGNVQVITTIWDFHDDDFAKIANVSSCSFLTATEETSIVKSGNVAVRLTNTAGTQTKDHSVTIVTDRDYLLDEIKVMKVSFDYYRAERREQIDRGFPKVQLMYNNSGKGNAQGGGEILDSNSVFFVTPSADSNWWHIEYFITALCPTMSDHGDTVLNPSQKINGIKITDSYIYDYNSKTAFVVIDNLEFDSSLSDRLGKYNRTSTLKVGGYFWFKVAWAGELNSCTMVFSDPTVAEQDLASTKSPFYIRGLKAGTTTATAILDIGEEHQILTIGIDLTVTP